MATDANIVIAKDIVRRAVMWFVRVQANLADDTVRRDCDHWRATHPHHELAWQRLQAIDSGVAADVRRIEQPRLIAETLTASARGLDPHIDRRRALKLLSLIAAGGVAWTWRDATPWPRWTADYATATGERRALTLPDRSLLQIDTASAVDFHFTDSERLLVLARGGLRLSAVAAARPLRVQTRHAFFETGGAVFALRRDDTHSRIDVEQGAVAIALADGHRHRVDAGQGLVVDHAGVRAASANGIKSGAWADGVIDTQNVRLGDFIRELARYRSGHLGCDDAVAGLRLSGVYRLDDIDGLLDIVQHTLPVRVVQRTRWWATVVARA